MARLGVETGPHLSLFKPHNVCSTILFMCIVQEGQLCRGGKQVHGCLGLNGEKGWAGMLTGPGFPFGGVENFLKLGCGVGCTTLSSLKTTEWCPLKRWTLCSVNCVFMEQSPQKPPMTSHMVVYACSHLGKLPSFLRKLRGF